MSQVRRFDHVGITVADLDAVTAFFVGLGLEVENRMFVEGEFLDTVIGIPDSRTEIVMLQPPDGGHAAGALKLRPARPPARFAGRPRQRAGTAATWPSRSMTCRRPLIGRPRTATGWSVASASTRALGGWLMSGVRKGLSSRWPSASAEPRKPDRDAEHGGLEAAQSSGICLSRSCLRRGVEKARHVCGPTSRGFRG